MTWLTGRYSNRREAISPPPASLDLSVSKSDRHQDFIQIPRIGCVFTQQEQSAFDRLLIRPSEPQRQPGSDYGSALPIWLTTALWELQSRAVAILLSEMRSTIESCDKNIRKIT